MIDDTKSCCHAKTKSTWSSKKFFQKIKDYQPLIIILVFCLLLSMVYANNNINLLMYGFMGYFFVLFSLFKFLNLTGFVDGFSSYDLVTKKFRFYGYCYPFIELILGIAYLLSYHLSAVNLITFILMFISGIGVIQGLRANKEINCACLGATLNVPLGAVSVLENFGMGIMALLMLLITIS